MTDRLHLIDPDPRRGCDRGCLACAQLDADFASIRRHAMQERINQTLADLEFIALHGTFPPAGTVPGHGGQGTAPLSVPVVRGLARVGVVDSSA